MKALKGIDGSLCAAILTNRSPTLIASANQAAQDRQARPTRTSRRPSACHGRCSRAQASKTTAARCSQTSSWLLSTFLPSRPFCSGLQRTRRYSHAATAARSHSSETPTSHITLESLLDVVGNENVGTVEEHLGLVQDPYLRRYAKPDGPNLRVSSKRDDSAYPSVVEALRGNPKISQITEKIRLGLATRRTNPKAVPLNRILATYNALPEPRMLHIPASLRHSLLKAMGRPTQKNATSMLRYFSLVDDIRTAGLALTTREWNIAISFAGQCVGRKNQGELENTLRLWNEMEKSGGKAANPVTFNILFDVAAKAGNFTLAEKIYAEMDARNMEFNRFHHVSLIQFFSLKGDADGVRAAYQEMVKAGEIIDTVVLNCLISSFIRLGEEDAALRVYEHMKTLASVPIPPDSSPKFKKAVTEVFMMYAKIGRDHPSTLSSFQKQAPSQPDLQTYRILVNHYSETAGRMNQVMQLLDEMQTFNIPIHGSIFLAIFKGFASFGNPGSFSWSHERLRTVFSTLLRLLDEEPNDLYIDTWLVGWSLRAFMRCAGPDAVIEAFEQLKARWKLDEQRSAHIHEYLHDVLKGRGRIANSEKAGRKISREKRASNFIR